MSRKQSEQGMQRGNMKINRESNKWLIISSRTTAAKQVVRQMELLIMGHQEGQSMKISFGNRRWTSKQLCPTDNDVFALLNNCPVWTDMFWTTLPPLTCRRLKKITAQGHNLTQTYLESFRLFFMFLAKSFFITSFKQFVDLLLCLRSFFSWNPLPF